jgi:hypothetical protein
MNDERFHELLERTTLLGAMPPEATDQERAELEAALATIRLIEPGRTSLASGARATMPSARARFQRYVQASGPMVELAGVATPRAGLLGRILAGKGALALAGSAAGIALVAVAAVIAWQAAFGGATSAYAQVVDPGDYVQVEGVVEDSADGMLELKSELGRVDVELSDSTNFVDDAASRDVSTLKRGDRLLVGGIAGEGRTLRAQTLAVGEASAETSPKVTTFKQLERLRPNLEGRVVTYTISSDGTQGSVLLDAGDGERYLVRVDGRSAERLLARTATALGQQVKVQESTGVSSGTFSLEVGPQDALPPGDVRKPSFVRASGVITGVQVRPSSDAGRLVDGLITLQSARGPVTIIVRPTTRIFPGESGLTPGAGLRGEANGHTIIVSGGIDKKTGNVVADVIILGPKLERPAR